MEANPNLETTMSAFIVSNDCIMNIVNHLAGLRNMEVYSADPLKDLGYDVKDHKSLAKLANDMLAMNIEAVDARYSEKNSKYKAKMVETRPIPAQAYKSLGCFLYQCSEGNVPEKPLYKALTEVEQNIAKDIIRALPGWDALKWG
jgi:hypothetical protein